MTDPQHVWTAAGADLDRLCPEGMGRQFQESDEALRCRILGIGQQPWAVGEPLDALVNDRTGMSRLSGEDDTALRARVRAEREGPQPGTAAHMFATCRRFDECAKLIDLVGTVIAVVDFDKDDRAEIQEALDHSRPAGVQFILTNDPMGSVKGMLDEARAEGTRQERALTLWQRAIRWWGGR